MIMLEDVCTLPSGTQIIIADMLIPGAIFQHGNRHQYVIKDIGKVKINNNWIDSVNYRRVESDIAITYTRTVDDFMKAMTKELQTNSDIFVCDGYRYCRAAKLLMALGFELYMYSLSL